MTQHDLLPTSKHDLLALTKLANAPTETLKKLAPELLTWTQDINWPIAMPMIDFVAERQLLFLPSLLEVFKGTDLDWQETLLIYLLPKLSTETNASLRPVLVPLFDTNKAYFAKNEIRLP